VSRIAEIRSALAEVLPDGINADIATGALPRDPKVPPTMGGGLSRQFVICVKTGAPNDPDAQEALDEALEPSGDRSIQAALEADVSLGGMVHHLEVVTATGWRHYTGPNGPQLGAEITVEIAA
jgi:hypothetical protein